MPDCIDIFCHYLPPALIAAVDAAGQGAGAFFARARSMPGMSDLDARLRIMDEHPGYRQVLSLASPPPEALAGLEAGGGGAGELCRVANDAMAAVVADHRDRFPAFVASLPMNDPPGAVREASRAVEQLNAAGVQVFTNVNGAPLDAPPILEALEAIAALGRPIWLHPWRTITSADYAGEPASKYELWWALGWPYETSVAMGRLAFSGIFDRQPSLKIITHHAGGMIPMMAGRLGPGMDVMGTRTPASLKATVDHALRGRPLDAFKRFCADTATFGCPDAVACGLAFFGRDRMLFATDMPYGPLAESIRAVAQLDVDEPTRRAILHDNARRLLRLDGGA